MFSHREKKNWEGEETDKEGDGRAINILFTGFFAWDHKLLYNNTGQIQSFYATWRSVQIELSFEVAAPQEPTESGTGLILILAKTHEKLKRPLFNRTMQNGVTFSREILIFKRCLMSAGAELLHTPYTLYILSKLGSDQIISVVCLERLSYTSFAII